MASSLLDITTVVVLVVVPALAQSSNSVHRDGAFDPEEERAFLIKFTITIILLGLGMYVMSSCLSFVARILFGVKERPQSTNGPTSVEVTVARFPVNGAAPCLERLRTTTKHIRIAPGLFPGHIPDVFGFWNLPPEKAIFRDWTTTQLKHQSISECNGIYLTIYYSMPCHELPENHNAPKIFHPPVGRVYGDVFVVRLAEGQCGGLFHGWAVYQRLPQGFFYLPFVKKTSPIEKEAFEWIKRNLEGKPARS